MVERLIARLRDQIATGGGYSIQVEAEELPVLQQFLDHYQALIEAEKRRKVQLRRAQDRAGRKPTSTPAASTLRARKSRAKKRAAKGGS